MISSRRGGRAGLLRWRVAADDLRVSAVGDGRAGVTGPQPDHLVRYRDEARSGSNADDDIGCEHGHDHANDYLHFSANGL